MTNISDEMRSIAARSFANAMGWLLLMGLVRLFDRLIKSERERMINEAYGMDLSFQPLAC